MEDLEQFTWTKFLDIAAKGVILCYGIGYLIDNIYDSVFGVYDLEVIRTRPLFSGVSFLLLIAIIYLALQIGGGWSFVSLPWRLLSRELERHELLPKSLSYLIYCAAKLTVLVELAQLSSYLFLWIYLPIDRISYNDVHSLNIASWIISAQERRFFILLVSQQLCFGAMFAVWHFLAPRMIRTAAGITVVLCVGYLICTKLIDDIPMGFLAWLTAVSVSILIVQRYLNNKTSNAWRLGTLLACLACTLMYARLVYPRMLPWFGGPPRSTVLITCNTSCSVGGKQMRLIEETNDGYYVIPYDDQQGNAVFIARGNVKEATFIASPKLLMK